MNRQGLNLMWAANIVMWIAAIVAVVSKTGFWFQIAGIVWLTSFWAWVVIVASMVIQDILEGMDQR